MIEIRFIFHVLSRYGRTDLAYRMITRPEYPSYGYWLKCGATSLWEDFKSEGCRFPNGAVSAVAKSGRYEIIG